MKTELSLHTPEEHELQAALRLYIDSFPEEERRPWETILNPADAAGPQLRSIVNLCDDGRRIFAGMVTVWLFDDFAYIEHLATEPSMRGTGIGAKVLKMLADAFRKPLVLECEHPSDDNPMAERRQGFYRRNGFHPLPGNYIQPPYMPGLPSVPLQLMSTDPTLSPATVTHTLHHRVYHASEA